MAQDLLEAVEKYRGNPPYPMNQNLTADAAARQSAARFGNRPEALLEILHDLQNHAGHVSDEAVAVLAEALNLSRADVHGVVSFYHDFRRQAGGRHSLRICRAEACQALGCESLVAHAEGRSGVACGHTAVDGSLTLEGVYCLGNCALGPAAMLDGRPIGRLDRARLDALLDRCLETGA